MSSSHRLPPRALVLMVGPAGAGKSTLAARFGRYQVVSSDVCRGLLSGDEGDQSASPEAFDLLRRIVHRRMGRGVFTVVDATNVRRAHRRDLLALARLHRRPAAAVVLNLPLEVCKRRDRERPGRAVGADVIAQQHNALQENLPYLREEPYQVLYELTTEVSLQSAVFFIAEAPTDA